MSAGRDDFENLLSRDGHTGLRLRNSYARERRSNHSELK